MKVIHTQALNFALTHFAISFILGVVCLMCFYGAGLSDTYQPTPFLFQALVAVLWVLQLPVAIFEAFALRHSQHGANVLLLCVLGFSWSLAVGYTVQWIRRTRGRRGST